MNDLFFDIRGLKPHAIERGEGETSLLLHGWLDHARSFDLLAPLLPGRTVSLDFRGHGDSAWAIGSSYGIAEYILDLAQLLRHVGETPVTLIGHSLGGAIVLQYAGVFPDHVLKVCAIEGMGPPPAMLKDLMEKPIEDRIHDYISGTQALPVARPAVA